MTRIYQGTAGTKNASRFLKFVTLEDKNWTQVMHEKEIMGKKEAKQRELIKHGQIALLSEQEGNRALYTPQ